MEDKPIEAFTNQVGGHTFELQNQGMLHQGNCILKQLQDMGRGDKEVSFYSTIGDKYPEFLPWIAAYHGIKEVNQMGIQGKFMVLDDLTYGYEKPSVMDIKLGTKTWEDDAPKEKIERESKKYPLQRKIGFRLTGMRVYNTTKNDYDVYDKKYGYSQTEETLNTIFSTFISQIPKERQKEVVLSIIDQIKPILAWFEIPGHLKFICTSLLLIFEGKTESEFKPIVRIVDFAHVKQLPSNEVDEGCIIGLKRVISELEILCSHL